MADSISNGSELGMSSWADLQSPTSASTLPGETPREAANRRKREAADRERERRMEATINHVATHSIRPRAKSISQTAGSDEVPSLAPFGDQSSPGLELFTGYRTPPRLSFGEISISSSADLEADSSTMPETPSKAMQRRKREAADRELERIRRDSVGILQMPKPFAPLYDAISEVAADDAKPPPVVASYSSSSPRSSFGQVETGETPREAARRRKLEAAGRDLERLKATQAGVASNARQIALQLRESHARSFTAPFATAPLSNELPGDSVLTIPQE
jgi:hypothetical protein